LQEKHPAAAAAFKPASEYEHSATNCTRHRDGRKRSAQATQHLQRQHAQSERWAKVHRTASADAPKLVPPQLVGTADT
jgi:hypothetical protein